MSPSSAFAFAGAQLGSVRANGRAIKFQEVLHGVQKETKASHQSNNPHENYIPDIQLIPHRAGRAGIVICSVSRLEIAAPAKRRKFRSQPSGNMDR